MAISIWLMKFRSFVQRIPARRRSLRNRTTSVLYAEVLEDKLCLSAAPIIETLVLDNDTDVVGDSITSDPTISGTITNDTGLDNIDIELDFDGDGIADDWGYANTDGTFSFDPSNSISSGEVTIHVRAVELDEDALYLYGDWVAISFTYTAPSNDPPVIATLGLENDTDVVGDSITSDPTISGTITNDTGLDYIDIELDFDGDGIADDWGYANADGTFSYDPSNSISSGEVTIHVRAVELDEDALYLYGDWVAISFTYTAPSNDPPVIATLGLENDTDVVDDNITSDPTISGTITNDTGLDYIDIELDFDGDGIADDWGYANADGTFSYDPSNSISSGEVTIHVRAVELDEDALYLYGDWVAISFTYLESST